MHGTLFSRLQSRSRAHACAVQTFRRISPGLLDTHSEFRKTCSCPWGDAGINGVFPVPSPPRNRRGSRINYDDMISLYTPFRIFFFIMIFFTVDVRHLGACNAGPLQLPIICGRPGTVFTAITANVIVRGLRLSMSDVVSWLVNAAFQSSTFSNSVDEP